MISKSRYEQPIDEVEISEPWTEKHWRSIELNYKKAPFFSTIGPRVRGWYEAADSMRRLTEVNRHFMAQIARELGLAVRITSDEDYPAGELRQTDRLVRICEQAGATHYLSGPSARAYLEEENSRPPELRLNGCPTGPIRSTRSSMGRSSMRSASWTFFSSSGPRRPSRRSGQ